MDGGPRGTSGSMPLLVKAIIGIHALVAGQKLIVLTAAIFEPHLVKESVFGALTSLLLYLGIIWGICGRRGGAWFLIALLQLTAIVVNGLVLLAYGGQLDRVHSIIAWVSIIIATGTVVYLLTSQAKVWFRIEEPRPS